MFDSLKTFYERHETAVVVVAILAMIFLGLVLPKLARGDCGESQSMACRVQRAEANGCEIPDVSPNALGDFNQEGVVEDALGECGY